MKFRNSEFSSNSFTNRLFMCFHSVLLAIGNAQKNLIIKRKTKKLMQLIIIIIIIIVMLSKRANNVFGSIKKKQHTMNDLFELGVLNNFLIFDIFAGSWLQMSALKKKGLKKWTDAELDKMKKNLINYAVYVKTESCSLNQLWTYVAKYFSFDWEKNTDIYFIKLRLNYQEIY